MAVSKNATVSIGPSTQGVSVPRTGAAHQILISPENKGAQRDLAGSSSYDDDDDGWDNVNSSQLIIDRLLLDRYDKNKNATLHLSPWAKPPPDLSHATGATERCGGGGAALSRVKTSDPVWKRYVSKINVFWWKRCERTEEVAVFPSASEFPSGGRLSRPAQSVCGRCG